jgi:excisionase family DNA binding protein
MLLRMAESKVTLYRSSQEVRFGPSHFSAGFHDENSATLVLGQISEIGGDSGAVEPLQFDRNPKSSYISLRGLLSTSGGPVRIAVPAYETSNSDSASIPAAGTGKLLAFIPEPLLDTVEAAAVMKIHPKTLQKLARRGNIHGIRLGKLWRFRPSDIQAWIASQ